MPELITSRLVQQVNHGRPAIDTNSSLLCAVVICIPAFSLQPARLELETVAAPASRFGNPALGQLGISEGCSDAEYLAYCFDKAENLTGAINAAVGQYPTFLELLISRLEALPPSNPQAVQWQQQCILHLRDKPLIVPPYLL